MATVEHCFYCFEALASHLEGRKSLSLAEVEDSYAVYLKALSAEAAANVSKSITKRHPALERLSGTSSGTASPVPPTSSSSASSVSSSPSLQQASGVSTPATSTSSLPLAAEEKIDESPLFVTWNIKHPRHGHVLRGCIGTFEPHELDDGLSSYAITSAVHDSRFDPISLRELPQLQVAVTLLTNFEDAADPMDWELGKHGIRISFVYHGRRYGATYLPDVAVEQGWDKEETIQSLMRKAGYVGRKDKWREMGIKVVRYEGKKEKCEYEEYKAWREWLDGQKGK
ncbi:AMMECR1 domain-containing protein [Coniochaeta sp. 2T2.1]|nr:AMMECR1 domain-containing protein [Coniochaeta sp. 2T2.1]